MPAHALFHAADRLELIRLIVHMERCKETGMPCWLLPTDSYWEGRPCSDSISSPPELVRPPNRRAQNWA